MQVDVTTRLGAPTPKTPTGLAILDRMLGGGIKTGTLVGITGGAGLGKTALSLLLAYMAARSRAAVIFTSVTLDETEIMARLAARALHREYAQTVVTYGDIWSGDAWQEPVTRGPVSESVEIVSKKVGSMLHLHKLAPLESTRSLHKLASELWSRHERMVLVVDGVEALSASCDGDPEAARAANSSLDGRIAQVSYELRRIAEEGCAVVASSQLRNADLLFPAATFGAELRAVESALPVPMTEQALALGARPLDLVGRKNTLGPTGIVPLRFVAGAATFEERAP